MTFGNSQNKLNNLNQLDRLTKTQFIKQILNKSNQYTNELNYSSFIEFNNILIIQINLSSTNIGRNWDKTKKINLNNHTNFNMDLKKQELFIENNNVINIKGINTKQRKKIKRINKNLLKVILKKNLQIMKFY